MKSFLPKKELNRSRARNFIISLGDVTSRVKLYDCTPCGSLALPKNANDISYLVLAVHVIKAWTIGTMKSAVLLSIVGVIRYISFDEFQLIASG